METIATFSKPEDAHLLRMRLEAAGIEACLQDENVVQLGYFSNMMGGVQVQVSEDDVAAAQEFLAGDHGVEPRGEA